LETKRKISGPSTSRRGELVEAHRGIRVKVATQNNGGELLAQGSGKKENTQKVKGEEGL